jgi:hypothetical protein
MMTGTVVGLAAGFAASLAGGPIVSKNMPSVSEKIARMPRVAKIVAFLATATLLGVTAAFAPPIDLAIALEISTFGWSLYFSSEEHPALEQQKSYTPISV